MTEESGAGGQRAREREEHSCRLLQEQAATGHENLKSLLVLPACSALPARSSLPADPAFKGAVPRRSGQCRGAQPRPFCEGAERGAE